MLLTLPVSFISSTSAHSSSSSSSIPSLLKSNLFHALPNNCPLFADSPVEFLTVCFLIGSPLAEHTSFMVFHQVLPRRTGPPQNRAVHNVRRPGAFNTAVFDHDKDLDTLPIMIRKEEEGCVERQRAP
ncbi:MAG: hypothetical protein L6R40_001057 [Gallowayella cf. fulva]|nr:MAG: hypothetical protein L6R40_001057 [Xanthomendoza cf. fulva]